MAKNNQKPTTETPETSTQSQKRLSIGRLKPVSRSSWLIIAAAILLLVAVGVYAVVGVADKDSPDRISEEKEDPRFPKQQEKMENLGFNALRSKVNQLQLSNQYAYAKKLIKHQDYYEKNKQAQMLYASICANQGAQREALQTLQQVEKQFGDSYSLAASIADQAVIANKKDIAIEYYDKAIRLLERSKNPVRASEIRDYKTKIKQLQES